MAKQRVSLAPLMGVNSRRVADRTLQGTYMRGGYNVELRDGEWWTRMGEKIVSSSSVRLGSTPWWWIVPINDDLTIIANPWWALALTTSFGSVNGVKELYTAAVTENVAVTNGSANVTTSTTRVVDQMVLMGVGATTEVYRIVSRVGTAAVLDRVYEGSTNAAKSCRFIDPLPRNTAGTATLYNTAFTTQPSAWMIRGSCVLFEQLVSHTATDLYAASPTLTGGNLHLVITSNVGVPVAIDLSAYIAGSTVGVRRTWFYNTALGSAATQIGTDTAVGDTYARGVYAEVYKGRLFIGAATDPNGKYGTRTLWYSQPGDLGRWHTGLAAQTAAPNFKTFDGEGNDIADMKELQDSLVIHRKDNQVVANVTGSLAQPFTFRSNNQGIGLRSYYQSNRVVSANGLHYIWTTQGPAVFDGNSVSFICEDARDALGALLFINAGLNVSFPIHDTARRRIYWYWGYPGNQTSYRHQDALPAFESVVMKSGETIYNYSQCFVYDYANNSYWFEDRPTCLGGGLLGSGNVQTPVVSRPDGTLVAILAFSTTGTDPDLLAPETSGSNQKVYAQVETPWIDFGNPMRKQLVEVEVALRSPEVGGDAYDDAISLTGTPWIRMLVYGDRNRYTAQADVGDTYSLSGPQLTTREDNRQSAQGLLTFSSRSHGRQFKFVFSNALTSSATSAGYAQLPFRISDIECEFVQQESTTPRRTQTSASISE